MKKSLKIILLSAGLLFGSFIAASAITCTNVFPGAFNNYTSGACIPSAWGNALEQAIGITGSTATSSVMGQLNAIQTAAGSGQIASSSLASSSFLFLQTANNGSDINSTSTFRTTVGAMYGPNNLSEITNTSTARNNLGITSTAILPSSTWFQVSNNLSEGNAATMRTNLGLGSIATFSSPLSIAGGGLGMSTAPTDHQFLSASGTTPKWMSFVAGNNIAITTTTTSTILSVNTTASAAAPQNGVQYNDGGTFAATSTFTFVSSTQALSVNNIFITNINTTSSPATGTLLSFNNGKWQSGIVAVTQFASSTASSAGSKLFATLNFPGNATTTTIYDYFIIFTVPNCGLNPSIVSSTLDLVGGSVSTTLYKFNGNAGGGADAGFQVSGRIMMLGSASYSQMFINGSSTFANSTFTQVPGTYSNYLQNFASSPRFVISQNGASSANANTCIVNMTSTIYQEQ